MWYECIECGHGFELDKKAGIQQCPNCEALEDQQDEDKILNENAYWMGLALSRNFENRDRRR